MAASTGNPPPSHPHLASILDQLACPACLSPLALDANTLTCATCGRVYPIIDGIPVLISEVENEGPR